MPPAPPSRLLIRRAELAAGDVSDVLAVGGTITAIGAALGADGAEVIDAAGARLLPGLHDHHLHVAASCVALQSVVCGPPAVTGEDDLARVLAAAPGDGWLRGIGYHDSVAGLLDRHRLDALLPHRPVRVQHRSGRMWFFNTAGLEILLGSGAALPEGLERAGGEWTGRLFDADRWLRDALAGSPPSFAPVGAALLGWGVTGLTDMSPANAAAEARHFAAEQASGALPQRVVLAGSLALGGMADRADLRRGPFKLHLHEHHLPDWDATLAAMREARAQGRGSAIHCVTAAELAFAIGLFGEAGTGAGDRIEHGSVISDGLLDALVTLGLPVVVQPAFVAARGDQYLADIPAADWPALYRLASLQSAGLVVAAGSDAPFGPLDPWAAMRAAVERRTGTGVPFGPGEALTPEAALDLFLADPLDLGRRRRIVVGAPADLCLLDRPWAEARRSLDAARVRLTIVDGAVRFAAAGTGTGTGTGTGPA